MDNDTLGLFFRVWTPVSFLLGIALVSVGTPIATEVGIVVLILSIVSLMPTLRFTWWEES